MKLVKKLLRLIPIFVVFGVLIACLSKNNSLLLAESTTIRDSTNTTTTSFSYRPFSDLFNSELDSFVNDYAEELPIFSSIDVVFDSITGYQYNSYNNTYLRFSLAVLLYELYLSFLFLIFDLFNFMLSVAQRFINKGEHTND